MSSFVVFPPICNQYPPYISLDSILNSKPVENERQRRREPPTTTPRPRPRHHQRPHLSVMAGWLSSRRGCCPISYLARRTSIERRGDLVFRDTRFLSHPSVGGTGGYDIRFRQIFITDYQAGRFVPAQIRHRSYRRWEAL